MKLQRGGLKAVLVLAASACVSQAALADDGCRSKLSSQPMSPADCATWRAAQERAAEKARLQEVARKQWVADIEAAKARDEEARRIDAQRHAEEVVKWEAAKVAEAERMANVDAENAREERKSAIEERRYLAAVAQRKKTCGADYGQPTIGMSLDRAQQCVGTFRMYSQVNRAEGVVTMYRAGPIHISVMGGRIVHWVRV